MARRKLLTPEEFRVTTLYLAKIKADNSFDIYHNYDNNTDVFIDYDNHRAVRSLSWGFRNIKDVQAYPFTHELKQSEADCLESLVKEFTK